MFSLNSTSKMTNKRYVTKTFTQHFRMPQYMGLYLGHQNHKRLLLCGAPVGGPRCRNFVVYLADTDYHSLLRMVIRQALACIFLQISFCVNEIENVERIAWSSHFSLKIEIMQKYVPTCIPLPKKEKT